MLLWVPEYQSMVYVQEGSGVNLEDEDINNGFDAYLDYTDSRMNDDNAFEHYDGGIFLYNSDECKTDEEKIQAFLKYVFDVEKDLSYVALNTEDVEPLYVKNMEEEELERE